MHDIAINPPNIQDEILNKIPLTSEPSPDPISTINLTESDSSIIQPTITTLNEQTMPFSKLTSKLESQLDVLIKRIELMPCHISYESTTTNELMVKSEITNDIIQNIDHNAPRNDDKLNNEVTDHHLDKNRPEKSILKKLSTTTDLPNNIVVSKLFSKYVSIKSPHGCTTNLSIAKRLPLQTTHQLSHLYRTRRAMMKSFQGPFSK